MSISRNRRRHYHPWLEHNYFYSDHVGDTESDLDFDPFNNEAEVMDIKPDDIPDPIACASEYNPFLSYFAASRQETTAPSQSGEGEQVRIKQEIKEEPPDLPPEEESNAVCENLKELAIQLQELEMLSMSDNAADQKMDQPVPAISAVPAPDISSTSPVPAPAVSSTSAVPVPAASSVSAIPSTPFVSSILSASSEPAISSLSPIPAASSVSSIPTAQSVSPIPAASSVSSIPTAHSVSSIPAVSSVSSIPAAHSMSSAIPVHTVPAAYATCKQPSYVQKVQKVKMKRQIHPVIPQKSVNLKTVLSQQPHNVPAQKLVYSSTPATSTTSKSPGTTSAPVPALCIGQQSQSDRQAASVETSGSNVEQSEGGVPAFNIVLPAGSTQQFTVIMDSEEGEEGKVLVFNVKALPATAEDVDSNNKTTESGKTANNKTSIASAEPGTSSNLPDDVTHSSSPQTLLLDHSYSSPGELQVATTETSDDADETAAQPSATVATGCSQEVDSLTTAAKEAAPVEPTCKNNDVTTSSEDLPQQAEATSTAMDTDEPASSLSATVKTTPMEDAGKPSSRVDTCNTRKTTSVHTFVPSRGDSPFCKRRKLMGEPYEQTLQMKQLELELAMVKLERARLDLEFSRMQAEHEAQLAGLRLHNAQELARMQAELCLLTDDVDVWEDDVV